MIAPLALPFPAWHTDDSFEGSIRLCYLSDAELIAADEMHDEYCDYHSSLKGWRLGAAEFRQCRNVSNSLRNFMSFRFKSRVRREDDGRRLASIAGSQRRDR